MDKDRFNKIVNDCVEFKPKGYTRTWDMLTENERVDAPVQIKTKNSLLPCEDCGSLVAGRSCSIFNSRFAGVKGVKRSPVDHWIKYCHTCEKKWDYTGQKTKNAK